MKIKQAAAAGVIVLICFCFVVWQQMAYPRVWNEIHLGMTRQEVYKRVGSPDQDTGEIKGAFWNNQRLTGRQELWLYFENDKVAMLSIKRYVGTKRMFEAQLIRFDTGFQ